MQNNPAWCGFYLIWGYLCLLKHVLCTQYDENCSSDQTCGSVQGDQVTDEDLVGRLDVKDLEDHGQGVANNSGLGVNASLRNKMEGIYYDANQGFSFFCTYVSECPMDFPGRDICGDLYF